MTVAVAPGTFATPDMSTAAYLMMRGLRILVARRVERRFEFVFADGERADALLVDWANSEARRYDDTVRAIKKLVNGHGGE